MTAANGVTRVAVVFNARRRRAVVDAFVRSLRERAPSVEVEVFATRGADDTPTQAEAACAWGCDALVSAGGDGTLRGVLGAALAHGVPVAPFPLGTSNDYAKTLGLRTPADVVDALVANRVRRQDAGCAEYVGFDGRPATAWFCSTAGVGLLAEVFRLERSGWVDAGRRLIGDGMYPILTTIAALGTRSVPGEVWLDGRSSRRSLRLFEISKVKEAGGLAFTPCARPDDGVFGGWALEDTGFLSTVLAFVLAATAPARFFEHARLVQFGGPGGGPGFTEARVEPDEVMGVHLNGDLVGRTPARFVLHPGTLATFVGEAHGG